MLDCVLFCELLQCCYSKFNCIIYVIITIKFAVILIHRKIFISLLGMKNNMVSFKVYCFYALSVANIAISIEH